MTTKVGLTLDPDHLESLAKQLTEEAKRAQARADKIKAGTGKFDCSPGCWNSLCTCIMIQPA